MILFYLFYEIISEVAEDEIYVNQPFAVISSFGFNSNASFHFDIYTDIESRLLLFMMTAETARRTTILDIYQICLPEHEDSFLTEINKTDFSPSTEFEWSSTITKKDIYYPVIVNCISNHTKYNIKYKYFNYKYLIDYRNEKFSLLLLIFSILHIFISLIWLINTTFNKSFYIPIQLIFAILPSIRSLKCIFHAYYWEKRKIMENLPAYINILIIISSGFFFFLFLSTTSLVFSGWGIFKSKCNWSELFEVYISTFALIAGLFSGINSQSTKIILISLTMNMFGFLWYMKINTDNFVNFLKILDSSISNDRMLKRTKLIRNFMLSTFICLAATVIIFSCSASEITEFFRIGILESSVLALELVELYFFYLRKEYEGEIETQKEISPLGPFFIESPNKKYLCFLQKVESES